MKNFLDKKTVIITGATDGLGLEIAKQASKLCSKLIVTGRSQKRIDEMIKNDKLKNAQGIVLDLTKSETIKSFVSKVENECDGELVLINNAGMWVDGPTEKVTEEQLQALVQTNLTGHMDVTRQLLPALKKNGGQIVFTNSLAGVDPSPFFTSYSATKFGLKGFARSLESELKGDNIKVSSIFPGGMDTKLFNKAGNDYGKEPWMMEAKDIAHICIYVINQPQNVIIDEISIRHFPNNIP